MRSRLSFIMNIQQAHTSDAHEIASVLQEAAQWLSDGGRALWADAEIGHERVLRDTGSGLFYVARTDGQLAGVMKFALHSVSQKGTVSFARYELQTTQ